MEYLIKEIAEITGVTQSTIRYYEKEKITPNFKRDKNNVRLFTEEDIELINFIKCLRKIGMPLREIRENIEKILDRKNNVTTREILIEHRDKLKEQKEVLQKYIEEIDKKLN